MTSIDPSRELPDNAPDVLGEVRMAIHVSDETRADFELACTDHPTAHPGRIGVDVWVLDPSGNHVLLVDHPVAGGFRRAGNAPYPATALGTTDESSRLIDVVLDDTVRVAVTGFGCNGAADPLFDVREVGSGSDLLALYQQLGAAYEIAVGAPLRNGVAPEQITSDITANMTGGFFDPGCPTWTNFAWDPVAGPSILAPLNLFTVDGQPPLQPNDGIELASIYPTAVSATTPAS